MTDARTDEQIAASVEKLRKIRELQHFGKLYRYDPLPKVKEFHDMGLRIRFRALLAGNQDGKTYGGAAETAMHLTGDYPDWWGGFRFGRPVEWWVAGEGALLTRDAPQTLLCGKHGDDEDWGGGLIPKDALVGKTLGRGVANGYDQIFVKHKAGGVSTLTFKSYDQGREKFQSKTLDGWWADEEPPEDIYSELLARVSASRGIGFLTLTPLKGRTKVISLFLDEQSADRAFVVMTIYEGIRSRTHTKEEIDRIVAGYQRYERAARCFGVPMAGEGLVFEIDEEAIKEPPLPIHMVPYHWRKIWGIDFGIAHPFAAALIFHDTDTDTIHLWHGIKMTGDQLPNRDAPPPLQHVAAMKSVASAVPVAWPHDGDTREKGSGIQLRRAYKDAGLMMLGEHATNPGGGIHVEPGVTEIANRMMTGRFKVSATCFEFFKEMRLYHRKDGLIVPMNDDLISATRYATIMRRKAVAGDLDDLRGRPPQSFMTKNDFNLFTGEPD